MLIKNLTYLVNQNSKKSVIFIFFLILVGMIVETLSIGLIIPVIALVTNENFFENYLGIVTVISNFSPLNFSERSDLEGFKINFIFTGIILIMLIYFIKAILLSFINFHQIKFVKTLELKWSKELFKIYLYQPYTFHLNKNTSMLLRNVDECNTLANGVHMLIILTTEILVLFGILLLLLFFTTTSAIFAIIFVFISISLFYALTKNFLFRWGKERHELMWIVIKQLQQGFQGIKDIKILGKQDFFVDQYQKNKSKYNSQLFKSEFIKSLPKFWLEFMVLMVLLGTTLILLLKGQELSVIFFTLGLFSAAAFRVLPSINRIINCLQGLKNDLAALNNVHNEIVNHQLFYEKKTENKLTELNEKIILQNVNYTYPNSNNASLSNINLEILKGQAIGIVGESGSGKSTLLDIILGLLQVRNGNISVYGNNLDDVVARWQKQIGYVSQNVYLTDDTIEKNIALGLDNNKINKDAINNSIKWSKLDAFISKNPSGVNTLVGERGARISGGERQRIGIARALYRNPSILVLDESTSSLDVETEKEIMKTIGKLKDFKTIIIVSHRPSTVAICDQIYKLKNGKITKKGNFQEVFN